MTAWNPRSKTSVSPSIGTSSRMTAACWASIVCSAKSVMLTPLGYPVLLPEHHLLEEGPSGDRLVDPVEGDVELHVRIEVVVHRMVAHVEYRVT